MIAHLPVAGVEAMVMAATINFLFKVKPEMLGLSPPPPAHSQVSAMKGEPHTTG
jgi:hypothetical protein